MNRTVMPLTWSASFPTGRPGSMTIASLVDEQVRTYALTSRSSLTLTIPSFIEANLPTWRYERELEWFPLIRGRFARACSLSGISMGFIEDLGTPGDIWGRWPTMSWPGDRGQPCHASVSASGAVYSRRSSTDTVVARL